MDFGKCVYSCNLVNTYIYVQQLELDMEQQTGSK